MSVLFAVLIASVVRAGPPGDGVVTDVSSLTSEQLIERSRTEAQRRQFDKAIWLLTVCVEREPKNHDCVALLASNFARRGALNGNRQDELEAARWYRRFLEVAPVTDRRVPRVQEILRSASTVLDPGGPLRVSLTSPRVLQLHQLARVSSSNPAVVTAVLQAPDELRLEGKRAGKARVTAWNQEGTATHWDIVVEKE